MSANGVLINEKATKEYILSIAKVVRPGWDCERVSKAALEALNADFKNLIRKKVKSHPTIGKTFKL